MLLMSVGVSVSTQTRHYVYLVVCVFSLLSIHYAADDAVLLLTLLTAPLHLEEYTSVRVKEINNYNSHLHLLFTKHWSR